MIGTEDTAQAPPREAARRATIGPADDVRDEPMPLQEHLAELRVRLIKTVIGVAAGMVGGCFGTPYVQDYFFDVLRRAAPEAELVYRTPTDAFAIYFKITFYLGVAFAMPIIVYQCIRFLAPGLTRTEKQYVYAMLPCVILCFFLGVSFASFVAVPHMFSFLLAFGDPRFKRLIDLESMLSFFSSLSLWTGVIFQLPVVMFLLASLGIAPYRTLRRTRKYAAIGLMILAAVITPSPEAGSMLIVWAPMYLLYEVGLILARFARPRRRVPTSTVLMGAVAVARARAVRARQRRHAGATA